MKKIGLICMATLACLSLTACGNNNSTKQSQTNSSQQKTHKNYYFDGTTANTTDVKIKITNVKFYKGDKTTHNKNLIAFEYTITNKTDKDINAIDGWQAIFNAYQDNKNTEGKLEVGPLPNNTSEKILHDQDQTIKKGGNVKCITTYELDSNSKPVVLKATKGYDKDFLGKKAFKIGKFRAQNDSVQNVGNTTGKKSNVRTINSGQQSIQSANKQQTSTSNSHTGDWHNDPELWSDVNNNDNWKGSMYENATPQDRYNYIENNHDYWATRDPNYYNE